MPHPRRIVQRLFYPRVGQVEPLLQKINPQHAFPSHRRPPVPHFGIHRFDQLTQFRPWHHLFHLFQKQRPPRLLPVTLKSACHRQGLLLHLLLFSSLITTLSLTPVDIRELIQSLPRGITPHKLALDLHVSPPTINEIVREKRAITPETATRLAKYFGNSEQFWLNLQDTYSLF